MAAHLGRSGRSGSRDGERAASRDRPAAAGRRARAARGALRGRRRASSRSTARSCSRASRARPRSSPTRPCRSTGSCSTPPGALAARRRQLRGRLRQRRPRRLPGARGVVTNTPDVLTNATAELAVALMLAAARRLGEARAAAPRRRLDRLGPGAAARARAGGQHGRDRRASAGSGCASPSCCAASSAELALHGAHAARPEAESRLGLERRRARRARRALGLRHAARAAHAPRPAT